jgi:2-oxo-4-hydroxy-4-carboxy-5-ureidoimidazoline decarboxylase
LNEARPLTLAELNSFGLPAFIAIVGKVFEHSPWVAQRAYPKQPFSSIEALHRAMMDVVRAATPEEKLALIRAHPELAGKEASEGALTPDSSSEQARLGFTALSGDEFRRIAELNASYRGKFGFPCIVALRLHATRESVLGEMERRLENNPEVELENAIEQIGHITRGRLEKLIDG